MELTTKTDDELEAMLAEINTITDVGCPHIFDKDPLTDQQWEVLDKLESDIEDVLIHRHPPAPWTPPDPKACSYVGVSGRKMRPTQKHRPALWENMLGTLYAMNVEGECKYFDYDHDAAIEFAGVDTKNETGDNRLFRVNKDFRYSYVRSGDTYANPRQGKLVLWTKR